MKKFAIIISIILMMTGSSLAPRVITGHITDSSGTPLIGVSIILKGTTTGAVSDANGNFTITVPDAAVLVFSFVGYTSEEVAISNQSQLNVVLKEEIAELEECVVVGYAQSDKRSIRVRGLASAPAAAKTAEFNGGYYANEFNTEGYSAIHENGFKNPMKEPLSTFSIDVDAASYSNVRRFINEGQKPIPDAVRIEEMINYFDYEYPQPKGEHPFSIIYELGQCPWNKDNELLHIGIQGEKMSKAEMPASNLVFLIDVSGSMGDQNKLPLLKQAMKLLVSQLRPQDKVAIVVYAGSSGLVLPSTPGNQKDVIIDALSRLESGGSTAGAEGLKLAYEVASENFVKDGNNRIILATDGDFNVGPSSNAEMERMIETYRDKGIYISVTGFGMGNYKDDKMEIIADKGNGNYSYIDNLMEARKVFVNEFTSTLYTIAKDVKIQIEFNPAYVKEYRLVGYENRVMQSEDFDNDKKDAGELGAGHTVTALYEIVPIKEKNNDPVTLTYQQSNMLPGVTGNHELAAIKFRYKKPDSDNSILITERIPDTVIAADKTSDNFRFSAAVAGFGMLLRNSEYKGSIDYEQVLSMAKSSKGKDADGYRSEFIKLVELSQSIITSMNTNE